MRFKAFRTGGVLTLLMLPGILQTESSHATLVEQKAMFGIELGMSSQAIRSELGRPDRVDRVTAWRQSATRYHYRRLNLKVYLAPSAHALRAFALRTSSKAERTRDDLGVGSSEQRLLKLRPKAQCYEFSKGRYCLLLAGARTEFKIVEGRVAVITIRFETTFDI
jgi:hypothetical protein